MLNLKPKKIHILAFTLVAGASFAFWATSGFPGASRSLVECFAEESQDRTNFVCALMRAGALDEFVQDRYGGVLRLVDDGSSDPSLPIEIIPRSIGPSGRGGARVANGQIEVVDGAGRVTHRNFESVDVKPFVPTMPTIAVMGNAGESPVKIQSASPVDGVNSGSAIFLGNAKNIEIDVSGRDGENGRSASVSAALQILRGELGVDESIRKLANTFGLTENISEPTVSAEKLGSSAGTCETVNPDYKSLSLDPLGGDFLVASTKKARDILVSRGVCERQTGQEISVQTICTRPPEINAKIRCDYPPLTKNAPAWRRPTVSKNIQITCADQIPDGSWHVTCAQEKYAVTGSAFRVDHITLKPSDEIKKGMAQRLYHTYSLNAPCRQDPKSGVIPSQYSYEAAFPNFGDSSYFIDNGTSKILGTDCLGNPMRKMDFLRLSGAIVYKNERNALPGTKEEQEAKSADVNFHEFYTQDITKLSYWASRGSEADQSTLPERSPYDNLSNKAAAPAHFYLLDPNATRNADEKLARATYLKGLKFLGYNTPSIDDALVGYDSLRATRRTLPPPDKKTDLGEGSIAKILCNLTGQEARDLRIGGGESRKIENYLDYHREKNSGSQSSSMNETCVSFLRERYKFDQSGSKTPAGEMYFRERIDYTFSGLKTGLALRRPAGAQNGDGSVDSFLRAVQDAAFEPRAIYIPGDLAVDTIKTVSYCKKIKIDDSQELLTTGERASFIGPEVEGGASFSTYDINQYQDFTVRNQSAEAESNKANTQSILAWANSFMKVKTLDPGAKNENCDQITISHDLLPAEKKTFERFKNLNGVLITAVGNTVSVYFSPVKIPGATKTIIANSGLTPGLYLPRLNVAPAVLSSSLSFSEIWAGDGEPRRADLGLSIDRSRDDPYPWDNNHFGSATLRADFSRGVEYFGIPKYAFSNAVPNLYSYPMKSFKGNGTISVEGNLATSEDDARRFTGEPSRGKPRFIKSLISLDLGVTSDGQGPTTVKRENARIYDNVILTSRVGSPQLGTNPQAYCLAPGITRTLKYPTKLISRRAEKITPVNRDRYKTQADANVVAHPEVSDEMNSRNEPVRDDSLYFTDPYVPTSMLFHHQFWKRVLDEPINLAQDYNSYLAQLQTNTSITRGSQDGSLSPISWFGTGQDCGDTNETSSYNALNGYDRHLSKRCMVRRFQEIGRRAPYMPPYSEWHNRNGRPPISATERSCFMDPSQNSSYCFEYKDGDTYRENRPPFFVHNARTVTRPSVFDKEVIWLSATPLFKGARPFTQRSLGGRDWESLNESCEYPEDPAKWRQFSERCRPSYNFFAGHFLPFLRTLKWVFYGPKNERSSGSIAQTYPSGYLPNVPFERQLDLLSFPVPQGLYDLLGAENVDSNEGRVIGGPLDGMGGARFHRGGFFLPPVGVTADVKFGRFIASYNNNCSEILRQTGCGFLTSCEDSCKSNDDIHRQEAALHAFHGSHKNEINQYGAIPASSSENEPDTYERHSNDFLWNEKELEWVGLSGYLFSGCGDNLNTGILIEPRQNTINYEGRSLISPNLAKLPGGMWDIAYLPTGLAVADDGGLYFGPLIGTDLKPVLGGTDDNRNQGTTKLNALVVDWGNRVSEGAMIYPENGIAGQLTSPSWDWSRGATLTLKRDGQESRLATVARIIDDAKTDVAKFYTPDFYYEPDIAIIPEVLAAFFLHSNIHHNDETDPSKPPKRNFNPYDPFAEPYYFERILGEFISGGVKAEIRNLGFTQNEFASGSSVTDSLAQNLLARGMIFSFGRSVPAKIKLAWEWDSNSLHATVKSLSTVNGVASQTTGVNADGSPDSIVIPGVDSLSSGVVVTYGASGILGGLDDSHTFTDGTVIKRSDGLNADKVRNAKMTLNAIPSSTASGTTIGDYFDPEVTNTNPAPFVFAENFCSKWRRRVIDKAFNFKTSPVASNYLSPYASICRSAALYGINTAPSECYDSFGNIDMVKRDANDQARLAGQSLPYPMCDDSFPSGTQPIQSDLNDCGTQTQCTPMRGFESNVYWTVIKVETELPLVINSNFNTPPSCEAGQVLKSRIYKADGPTEVATFSAPGWAGACGTPDNMSCPGDGSQISCPLDKPIQVGTVFTKLYEQPGSCYSEESGRSVPDTRVDKKLTSCPKPSGDTSTYVPTVVELDSNATYVEEGTVFSSSFPQPTGRHAPWSIFTGVREVSRRTVAEIAPDEASRETGWIKQADYFAPLACKAVPYDPTSGTNPCGVGDCPAANGYPRLVPKWQFLETQRRFGALDPYYVKTQAKQSLIPSVGGAVTVSSAADTCNWTGDAGRQILPESPEPKLRPGLVDDGSQGTPPTDYAAFTNPIDYEWIGGLGANVTKRQYTPWSSERTDGDTVNAPSCSIFDDTSKISQEAFFPITPDAEGIYSIGDGSLRRLFKSNGSAAPDSSINNEGARFATGGVWGQVGFEQIKLTRSNSLVDVNCRVFTNSADGQDICDANIPITYETVEGFQVAVRAEHGENGGNAGLAIALTTFKPEEILLKSEGGKGGAAGGTKLDGATGNREMTCYQDGKDPMSPWIKIYRFNKSVVTVAPASAGNTGRSGTDNAVWGWGVHPDALKFLERHIMDKAKKDGQPN